MNRLSVRETIALCTASILLVAANGVGFIAYSWTETFGFISGGACVWLAVRQHLLTWPLGLLNNALFFALFLESRLFADMGLQLVYFALGVYGWILWRSRRGADPLAISRMPQWEWIFVLTSIPILTIGLRSVLVAANGAAPLLDASTTSLSLAGQYLLGRKRIENWGFWIAADLIYVPLYASRALYLTAVLYAIFLAMCIVGLRDWRRIRDMQHEGV